MKLGNTKLFNDKERLYELINLRRNGWALSSLALYFGADESSISVRCTAYQVRPIEKTYQIERIVRDVLPKPPVEKHFRILGGEKTCIGKSYKEYLISK